MWTIGESNLEPHGWDSNSLCSSIIRATQSKPSLLLKAKSNKKIKSKYKKVKYRAAVGTAVTKPNLQLDQ